MSTASLCGIRTFIPVSALHAPPSQPVVKTEASPLKHASLSPSPFLTHKTQVAKCPQCPKRLYTICPLSSLPFTPLTSPAATHPPLTHSGRPRRFPFCSKNAPACSLLRAFAFGVLCFEDSFPRHHHGYPWCSSEKPRLLKVATPHPPSPSLQRPQFPFPNWIFYSTCPWWLRFPSCESHERRHHCLFCSLLHSWS